jgi:recombination protein RecT
MSSPQTSSASGNSKLALREAIYSPAMLAQFARALPKGFPPEKMAASIELAASNNPALANCDLGSVLRSALAAAEFGWSVHWGPTAKCALVPFGKTCQLVVGYRGYIDLMARGAECRAIHSDLVREGDKWRYWVDQDGVKFRHERGEEVLNEKLEDTRAIRFAYAVYYYRGGGCEVVISTKADFERVKRAVFAKLSAEKQAASPYTTEPGKMQQKRALRVLANRAPITAELQRAIALEAAVESAERDMGDAERIRPLDVPAQSPAALPEPAVRETIEPPAAREVEVAPAAKPEETAKKMLIEDESTMPDKPVEPSKPAEAVATWPDTAEDTLSQWEGTEELISKAIYEALIAEVQRLPRGKERATIGKRIEAVGKRGFAADRQPGEDG